MWFLTDPDERAGLADSFLQSLHHRELFIISNEPSLFIPKEACFLDEKMAHDLYERFIASDFVRIGSRHGLALEPHVAINHIDDQNSVIMYYIGPLDKKKPELQFFKDLPMIEAVFFLKEQTRKRLYLPCGLEAPEIHLDSMKSEDGVFYIDKI